MESEVGRAPSSTKAKLKEGLRIHGAPILVMIIALMAACLGAQIAGEFGFLLAIMAGSLEFLAIAWAGLLNVDACTCKALSEDYATMQYKYLAGMRSILTPILTILGGVTMCVSPLFVAEGWSILIFIGGLNMVVVAGVMSGTNKLMLNVLDANQEAVDGG